MTNVETISKLTDMLGDSLLELERRRNIDKLSDQADEARPSGMSPRLDAVIDQLPKYQRTRMAYGLYSAGVRTLTDLCAIKRARLQRLKNGRSRDIEEAATRVTDSPKKDPRARLSELLGADSTNFLGTGLTMREFMRLTDAEKLATSWAIQSRVERKRRLHAVMQLSVELAHIRETTEFSTRLAEMAIEAVIGGDWKMVEAWAEHFTFDTESEQLRERYTAIFAVFHELLLQTLRTAKDLPA